MRGYFGNEYSDYGAGRGNRGATSPSSYASSGRTSAIHPARAAAARLRDTEYDMSEQILFNVKGVFGKLSIQYSPANDGRTTVPVSVAINPDKAAQAGNGLGKQEFVTAAKMVVGTFIKRRFMDESRLPEKSAETLSKRYTVSFQPPIR